MRPVSHFFQSFLCFLSLYFLRYAKADKFYMNSHILKLEGKTNVNLKRRLLGYKLKEIKLLNLNRFVVCVKDANSLKLYLYTRFRLTPCISFTFLYFHDQIDNCDAEIQAKPSFSGSLQLVT